MEVNAIDLSDRKIKILYTIISNYIKTGEPIGSKNLCNLLDFSVSPATIRNELSELTNLGFLEQPHTSAARIPSYQGYRFYINELMPKKYISYENQLLVDNSLNLNLKVFNPEEILHAATNVLANMSNLTVISTIRKSKDSYIKNIQLVKTGRFSVMLILTTSTGFFNTKIFKCEYELDIDLMNTLHQNLNEKFAGVKLLDVTPGFIQCVAASLGEIYLLIPNALLAVFESVKDALKNAIHLSGQTNLLFSKDTYDALKIIKLLNNSDCTETLLEYKNKKTTVSIGQENYFPELYDSSFIKTNFLCNKKIFGTIGIIGPIRVDYSSLIAQIEYIASTTGTLLENILDFE